MKKFGRLVALAVIAGAILAPAASRASHCTNEETGGPHRIVIFSYPVGLNSNALVCLAAAEDTDAIGYDGRLINPGSTAISLRFTSDFGAEFPTLTATLNGLGFSGTTVTLNRELFPTGQFVYNSSRVDIPGGPTAMGSVTATVALPDATTESNTFHTVGS